ncbi:regulator of chromosome condensation 1/beta-lactamase-inhibitor protein II [Syncephalastrum racemosum]|uniref:Regulator of chromosome condensation 1/beta-lactamase-inhibitor protein II n=1 Tax=Syncephalastrum racemosum TaxID=13706 RepID=A0A1X2H1E9_SYNRA|nr:regulator of chromosome condensation 1/beta-lactamase-inhibitor protein II [Syncephalastrum racemosum]
MTQLCNLPTDILLENICPYLDAPSLLELTRTCKTFQFLANDELLWRHLVLEDYNVPRDASYRHSGWKTLYSRLKDSVVYTWGENVDYRLGHNPPLGEVTLPFRMPHGHMNRMPHISTPKVLEHLRGKGIVDIMAGGWSFHALDRHGRVWMWGIMQADIAPRRSFGARLVGSPTEVNLPADVQVRTLSCGRSHAVALDRSGRVWHWSNHKVVQPVIFPSNPTIVQVTANWGQSTALSETGEIFLIPMPDYANEAELELQPTQIQLPPATLAGISERMQFTRPIESGDKFVQIAGMEDTTLALSRHGRVFLLRTKVADDFAYAPATCTRELEAFSATTPEVNSRTHGMQRFISAQFRRFAVYTSTGQVMLGGQNDAPDAPPQILDTLHHNVCKVSFGDYHCGALTNDGKLITWGRDSKGALGRGDQFLYNDDEQAPAVVESLSDMYVFAIGFGGWHSGVLAIPR